MTSAQLAKSLNLSRTTVSLVLNSRAEAYGIPSDTIRRVRAAAEASNYSANPVARQLAGKRSNVVGLLINTASIVDPRLTQKMEVLDVAVVGTDNLGVASLVAPHIINIDLCMDALAEASVALLFEMTDGPKGGKGRGMVIKPRLIVRQSS